MVMMVVVAMMAVMRRTPVAVAAVPLMGVDGSARRRSRAIVSFRADDPLG